MISRIFGLRIGVERDRWELSVRRQPDGQPRSFSGGVDDGPDPLSSPDRASAQIDSVGLGQVRQAFAPVFFCFEVSGKPCSTSTILRLRSRPALRNTHHYGIAMSLQSCRVIHDILSFHRNHRGDAEAAVQGDERISFATLAAQVDHRARALLSHGVRRGDRVATLAPPSRSSSSTTCP
ncbi:MAG: hypothetical protein CM15mP74_00200 [Halieaceae bacterium]|nr:MAG: hypothetical protein CM15mP74_00200 [Halieaceae bacterium]